MTASLGVYQCFAFLWHIDRGNVLAAQAVMAIPPEMLRGFDDLLRGAWLAGAAEAARDR
jgi:hypothetical protein